MTVRKPIFLIALLMVACGATVLNAQRLDVRTMPIMRVLDANRDGEISAEEIKNAAEALKSLDRNEDGKLTMDELRPDFRQLRTRNLQRNDRPSRTGAAPQVGDSAPAFKLKSLDGKSETDIADFKGKKPVVLLFGSYT